MVAEGPDGQKQEAAASCSPPGSGRSHVYQEGRFVSSGPLERVTGHEGAQRMLHHLRTAILPETRFEILDMVEEGDRVAVRWLFSGVKDVIWS
jgi:predicted ester cyclase